MLAFVFLTGFIIKLLCWHMDPTVSRDGSRYIRFAQIWYETGNFQGVLQAYNKFWLPPLPLYLIKCIMHFGLSAETAGVLINLISGAVAPLLTYGIAKEITQKQSISICSGLLTAVNPALNSLSIEIQRDMIYLLFSGINIWLLSAGIRRQKIKYWFGAGTFCGCAILTRFEAFELLIISLLAILYMFLKKQYSLRQVACYVGIYYLSFFLLVFVLSSLMQTQDYLFPNYKHYYQTKCVDISEQFMAESEEQEK